MAFSLFGKTPASLFGNADRFFAIVASGFAFRYEPSGDKAGVVVAEVQGGEVHQSLFHQIRGNLRAGFSLCGANGGIDLPSVERQDAQAALVRIRRPLGLKPPGAAIRAAPRRQTSEHSW